ncbi:MAG: hypothetical protein ACI305_05900 [Lepagella sp.]
MNRLLLAIVAAALCGGCVNLYTRSPFTGAKIRHCYQSTCTAAAGTIVVTLWDCSSFSWTDVLRIPVVGCLCLCDVACEAAVDTACLPFDWPLSAARGDGCGGGEGGPQ